MKNLKIKNKIISVMTILAVSATAVLGGVTLASSNGTDFRALADTQIVNKTPESQATVYYIGTPAEGDGSGTQDSPYSIDYFTSKIVDTLKAGDIVRVMPGEHYAKLTMTIAVSGTHDDYIIFEAADPAQKSILNFKEQKFLSTSRGIEIEGNYVYWRNIDVCGAGDNGLYIGGSYNFVENCEFYKNRDTGLQLGRSNGDAVSIDQWPSYNYIKNCTAYNNYDNETYGENADGFAAKLTVGYGNIFDGCIAYRNSDDGWDLYGKPDSGTIGSVILYNCVAFENGYILETQREYNDWYGESYNPAFNEDNLDVYTTMNGDGNGFKLGGSTMQGDSFMYNCLSFNNRMHGVTDNSNPGVISLDYVTSYNNSAQIDNTTGKIVDKVVTGEDDVCNNIDIARHEEESYNNFAHVLSIDDNSNSLGNDKFRGAGAYSLLANNTNWYKITEVMDADSYKSEKKGTVVPAVAASEIFEAVPANDLGMSLTIHKDYRNADGSVNMGKLLKIKDYSKLLGEDNKIGCDLSKSSWEDYPHPVYTYLTSEEVTSDDNAVLTAVKDMLYVPCINSACFQDFQLVRQMNGCSISWKSSDENLVKIDTKIISSVSNTRLVNAYVYRDANEDKTVTLTATITSPSGKETATKEFKITLKKNVFEVGEIQVEGVDVNNTIQVEKYEILGKPAFTVTNASDYNGKLLPEGSYTTETTYLYAPVKGARLNEVKGFTTSNEGIYQITEKVILPNSTNSYTYTIYVVASNATIDFLDASQVSVSVNKDGYTISGELNNVAGTIYSMVSDTEPTAEQLISKGQAFKVTTDMVYAPFTADNSHGYTLYYVICNPDGQVTSKVYSKTISESKITTTAEFQSLATNGADSSKIYLIENDLDFTGVTWTVNTSDSVAFSGLLNGQGHTISNITVADSSSTKGKASIFYRLAGGTIINVNFDKITLSGSQDVGIIAQAYGGYLGNIRMTDVSVKGEQRIGCLVGHAYELIGTAPLTIDNVSLINKEGVAVESTNQRVAGILGFIQTNSSSSLKSHTVDVRISNCYVDATIGNLNSQQNGGIIGTYDSSNTNGVVDFSVTITNCYFVGKAYGDNRIGGIIAYQQGLGKLRVTGCVNAGDIYYKSENPSEFAQKNASGIFGGYVAAANTIVNRCYAKFDEHNSSYNVELIYEELMKKADFWSESVGFDTQNVWKFDAENAPYCTLR
ncbi:MAG: hypothetical protein ACI4MH_07380 [Candidatus Coproplasma sp.]